MTDIEISEVRRLDRVRLQYTTLFNTYNVEGLIDSITPDAIYVGNRYIIDADGTRILNPKRYKTKNICSLKKFEQQNIIF